MRYLTAAVLASGSISTMRMPPWAPAPHGSMQFELPASSDSCKGGVGVSSLFVTSARSRRAWSGASTGGGDSRPAAAPCRFASISLGSWRERLPKLKERGPTYNPWDVGSIDAPRGIRRQGAQAAAAAAETPAPAPAAAGQSTSAAASHAPPQQPANAQAAEPQQRQGAAPQAGAAPPPASGEASGARPAGGRQQRQRLRDDGNKPKGLPQWLAVSSFCQTCNSVVRSRTTQW